MGNTADFDIQKGGRHHSGPRVAVLLVALALVPLLGAAWFAGRELLAVRAAGENAEDVEVDTRDLVLITALRASVLDERNWVAAVIGAESIGLDPRFIAAFTGIDLLGEQQAATERVDALVEEMGDPEMQQRFEAVRSSGEVDLKALSAEYGQIEEDLAQRGDRSLTHLLALAGEVPDGADLILLSRILDSAATARQSVASQLSSYFSAQFSGSVTAREEVIVLIQQQAIYDRAIAQINRLAGPESNVRAQLDVIADLDSVDRFRAELVALTLLEPGAVGQDDDGGSLDFVLGDVTGAARTFEAGKDSSTAHLVLVNAAGQDVLDASRAMTERADDRSRQALVLIGTVFVLSMALAVILARFIARPMMRLAAAAQGLRDGTTKGSLAPSGPFEVRAATVALNEAGAHLELAERQANALAAGDLDHPALTETAPGSLGASLQTAVRTLADSLNEREEFRRRLAHEANHDGLTRLPNRKACLAQLHRGLARTGRTEATLAVLFIDLDGFKDVNDRFGHPAGDEVLRATAQRLVTNVREGDHVGRLGGDEFVVIAEPVSDAAEAFELAERLLIKLCEPVQVGSLTVRIGASIGVAVADDHGLTADELLRDADLAVYQAKADGRNRVQLCDESLREDMVAQADLELALRAAIVDDEFSLYYQPIVDPTSGRSVGMEALIRWHRSDGVVVSPDDFIPFAERSNLIVDIDCWVVRRVAQQMAHWQEVDRKPSFPVSINISGRHLAVDTFVENVLRPLREFGVDPRSIVIEVTESALLDDLTSAAVKLQELRTHGIKVAIDDFGTGYTSLAHLKTLPIDVLKIDRSFTGDESSRSLVKLIIDTGHLLGATITAEGIETEEQADQLAALGTDEFQGYLYGRPCPPEDLSPDRGLSAGVTSGVTPEPR